MASTNPQFQGWIPWKRLRGKVVNQILAAVFFVFAVLCVFVATKDSPVTLLGSEFLVVAVAFGLYHLVDKLVRHILRARPQTRGCVCVLVVGFGWDVKSSAAVRQLLQCR
mmetsp:Transcript_53673/g.122940  ORF Transcript_53673/g.122940 Transcript_53673/m.122940 type:complete len:110 (+) Transcript_53673:238-567(+)